MMKSRGKKNNNKKMMSPARVERVAGRTLVQVLSSATSGVASISPATFPRCLAMADVFEFYRFTKLQVQLYPQAAADYVVGYTNQGFDTPPTTLAGVIELPYARLMSNDTSIPLYLNIGRSELLSDGNLKWYKTILGTPATQFEVQGNLYVAASTAIALSVVVEWEVEFSQWNLAAQSPKPLGEVEYEAIPGTNLYRKKGAVSTLEVKPSE
jgi:hypothetical protein